MNQIGRHHPSGVGGNTQASRFQTMLSPIDMKFLPRVSLLWGDLATHMMTNF